MTNAEWIIRQWMEFSKLYALYKSDHTSYVVYNICYKSQSNIIGTAVRNPCYDRTDALITWLDEEHEDESKCEFYYHNLKFGSEEELNLYKRFCVVQEQLEDLPPMPYSQLHLYYFTNRTAEIGEFRTAVILAENLRQACDIAIGGEWFRSDDQDEHLKNHIRDIETIRHMSDSTIPYDVTTGTIHVSVGDLAPMLIGEFD